MHSVQICHDCIYIDKYCKCARLYTYFAYTDHDEAIYTYLSNQFASSGGPIFWVYITRGLRLNPLYPDTPSRCLGIRSVAAFFQSDNYACNCGIWVWLIGSGARVTSNLTY